MSPTGPEQKRGKGNLQNTIAGALSGAVSRLVVSPLDVIKIRFQIQREPIASGSRSHYTGFVQAFRTVVKEEGIKVREMWDDLRTNCISGLVQAV